MGLQWGFFFFFFFFPPPFYIFVPSKMIFFITNAVIGEHIVKYKGHEVHNLNELEFIDGEVWANVWQVSSNFSQYIYGFCIFCGTSVVDGKVVMGHNM